MDTFLKRFVAAAVTLAGVVGLYLGAVAVDLVWVFWFVIGGSAVVAALPAATKRAVDAARRIRHYPQLVRNYGNLQQEHEELQKRHRVTSDRIARSYADGYKEGQDQVLGALRAEAAEVPAVKAIGVYSGAVCLIGSYVGDKPVVTGSRYVVVASTTGNTKGFVEVAEVDEARKIVTLRCAIPTVQPFWEHLAERVEYDESAPKDVELRQYSADEAIAPPHAQIAALPSGDTDETPQEGE